MFFFLWLRYVYFYYFFLSFLVLKFHCATGIGRVDFQLEARSDLL